MAKLGHTQSFVFTSIVRHLDFINQIDKSTSDTITPIICRNSLLGRRIFFRNSTWRARNDPPNSAYLALSVRIHHFSRIHSHYRPCSTITTMDWSHLIGATWSRSSPSIHMTRHNCQHHLIITSFTITLLSFLVTLASARWQNVLHPITYHSFTSKSLLSELDLFCLSKPSPFFSPLPLFFFHLFEINADQCCFSFQHLFFSHSFFDQLPNYFS